MLDLDQPWKVISRGGPYLLSPQVYYKLLSDVPNVAFPCDILYDQLTRRIAIYYIGVDTVIALTFARLNEVLDFVKPISAL